MTDLEPLPARVAERWPGREVLVLAATGSTNDVAKERARAGAPAGLVVVADRQTAGRGRMGRSWHSASGEGLYLSVLVQAPASPAAMTRLPLASAVAVHESLERIAPGLRVKWPNDVLAADGRKLAGILCEGLGRVVIVGVGLNIAHAEMPEPLRSIAVSLRMLGASAPSRTEVAIALLHALDDWLPRCETEWNEVRSAWLAASETIGRHVRIADIEGRAVALDDDGALVVETARGERKRVVSGDVE